MDMQPTDPIHDIELRWRALRLVEGHSHRFLNDPSLTKANELIAALTQWRTVHAPDSKLAIEHDPAGPAPTPRQVNTIEELDALPYRTLIQERDGFARIMNMAGEWHLCLDTAGSSPSKEIGLPATVLYDPSPRVKPGTISPFAIFLPLTLAEVGSLRAIAEDWRGVDPAVEPQSAIWASLLSKIEQVQP